MSKQPARAPFAAATRLPLGRAYPIAREICEALMGVKGVRIYHDQALFKQAGGSMTPWHQDQFYWPLDTTQTITLWLPLVDVPREMGTMSFAAGSHCDGPLTDLAISDESQRRLDTLVRQKAYPVVSFSLKAGDGTFHSGWTVHNAHGNSSDRMREVLTVIYYPDGTRLMEHALLLNVRWEQLTTDEFTPSSADDYERPDAFVQMPAAQTNRIQKLRYLSKPLAEDLTIAGPSVLNLFASIDQDDTNWIVSLKDVGPDDSVRTVREGEREIALDLPEREVTLLEANGRDLAAASGLAPFLVGGAVRDLLLGEVAVDRAQRRDGAQRLVRGRRRHGTGGQDASSQHHSALQEPSSRCAHESSPRFWSLPVFRSLAVLRCRGLPCSSPRMRSIRRAAVK